jgi:hypothetical protein
MNVFRVLHTVYSVVHHTAYCGCLGCTAYCVCVCAHAYTCAHGMHPLTQIIQSCELDVVVDGVADNDIDRQDSINDASQPRAIDGVEHRRHHETTVTALYQHDPEEKREHFSDSICRVECAVACALLKLYAMWLQCVLAPTLSKLHAVWLECVLACNLFMLHVE